MAKCTRIMQIEFKGDGLVEHARIGRAVGEIMGN
jgi:hypothetical protein